MLTSRPARRRKFRTAWTVAALLAFVAIAPTQSPADDAARTGERLVFTGEYRYPADAHRANPRIVDTAQHQPQHEPPRARSVYSPNKLRPQFSSLPPETAKPDRLEITTDPSLTETPPPKNHRDAPTAVARIESNPAAGALPATASQNKELDAGRDYDIARYNSANITTGAVAGTDNEQTQVRHATTANRQSTAPRLTVKTRSRPLSTGSARKSRSKKSRSAASWSKRKPRSRRKVARRSQPAPTPARAEAPRASEENGYPKWAVSAFTPLP